MYMYPVNKKGERELLQKKMKTVKKMKNVKLRIKPKLPTITPSVDLTEKTAPSVEAKVATSTITTTKPKIILKSKTKVTSGAAAATVAVSSAREGTPDILEIGSSKDKTTQVFVNKEWEYEYKIEKTLSTNFDEIVVTLGKTRIYLVIHKVNTSGMYPFLQFMLYKYPITKNKDGTVNAFSEKCFFPFKGIKKDGSVKEFVDQFITKILRKTVEPSGFIQEDNDVYVFVNLDNVINNIEFIERKDTWIWSCVHEIVNQKSVLNFPIHKSVFSIFLKYPNMNYLYKTGSNDVYEVPTIGYHGTYYTIVPFILSYGLRASTLNSMMGPYFYFGTYKKAVRYAGWTSTYKKRFIDDKLVTDENGKYIHMEDTEKGNPGALVRFALFLGKTKVFLNHPTERDDYSTLELSYKDGAPGLKKYREKIIKLHDHDGIWAEDYDSAYIGSVKLSTGKKFMSNPEFIVKQFEQQLPISYHYLDRKTLKPNWDPKYEEYYIQ